MPTAPVDVDTNTYLCAGALFLEVNGAVCDVVADAATAAGGGGGMAGTDSGGVDWSSSYDAAAANALTTGATLVDSLGHVGTLLAASADNHAAAEASSVPGAPVYAGNGGAPGAVSVVPATPPSADGTSDDPPAGWFLVAHLLEYTWPNGHQAQLRTVAAGWAGAATDLDAAADRLTRAIGDISALHSPEIDAAVETCCSVQQSVRDLSSAYATLGVGCAEYAGRLDEAHSDVLRELAEMAAETALIQLVSAAVAVPSAGSGEVAGQAAQAARIAATATRVGQILGKLAEFVRIVTSSIRLVVTRIADVLTRLRAVLAKGATKAIENVANSAEYSRLRHVTCSARQLENKYKHAADFGVLLPRGRAGFTAFGRAIETFVQRPTTIRVSRPYRGQPAVLNYDPVSKLAVVQTPEGEFVTGWRMTLGQWENVSRGRPLGGS